LKSYIRWKAGFSPLKVGAAAAALLFTACGGRGVRTHLAEPFPAKLSAWHLFIGDPAALKPNAGVIPYDLNTPLFSDYATKYRFVWMPPGTSATYSEAEVFDFPAGTIFSKTFAFPDADQGDKQRIIETRLLVHGRSGWVTLPYVWNREQTEATLDVAADPATVHWVHPSGTRYTIDYVIPNTNQCKGCHDTSKTVAPIGPKARNLAPAWLDAQHLTGRLDTVPAVAHRLPLWEDRAKVAPALAARAYLEANCAYCHNARGAASNSGLWLGWDEPDPVRLGLRKPPVAAGRGSGTLAFDVAPGDPGGSILLHRMDSNEPGVAMPEIGRSSVDRDGLAVIRAWIASLR